MKDGCGICGGDNSTCKRTHVKVQAQSSFRVGVSKAVLKQAVSLLATGKKEGVNATVQIVSFVQQAEADLALDGFYPSWLSAGSAKLNQVLQGLATALGVRPVDISVAEVSRRQLQTGSTTVSYTVVATFDFSATLLNGSFRTSLASQINAAGSALPVLSPDDLSTTEPRLSTTVDYILIVSSENASDVTSLNTSIADAGRMATSFNASGGNLAASAVSSTAQLVELVVDCRGLPGGNSSLDVCAVCAGGGASCLDCNAVANGGAHVDNCGVCDGDDSNDCDIDCRGVWGGSNQIDNCSVCFGNNSCLDCSGEPHGAHRLDGCSVCQVTFEDHCGRDCEGVLGGSQMDDACGDCGGDGSACRELSGTGLSAGASTGSLRAAALSVPTAAEPAAGLLGVQLALGAGVGAVFTLLTVAAYVLYVRNETMSGKEAEDDEEEDEDEDDEDDNDDEQKKVRPSSPGKVKTRPRSPLVGRAAVLATVLQAASSFRSRSPPAPTHSSPPASTARPRSPVSLEQVRDSQPRPMNHHTDEVIDEVTCLEPAQPPEVQAPMPPGDLGGGGEAGIADLFNPDDDGLKSHGGPPQGPAPHSRRVAIELARLLQLADDA